MKSLDLFIYDKVAHYPFVKAIRKKLSELGIDVNVTLLNPAEREGPDYQRFYKSDYDLVSSLAGVNDPDPDSAWRYMMQEHPGEKKPVSVEELDAALLDADRASREKRYHAFERRNVENPFFFPLRMVGSKVLVRPPLLPPEDGQFEWGVQLWKFRMAGK